MGVIPAEAWTIVWDPMPMRQGIVGGTDLGHAQVGGRPTHLSTSVSLDYVRPLDITELIARSHCREAPGKHLAPA